jgi:hypothetical protein
MREILVRRSIAFLVTLVLCAVTIDAAQPLHPAIALSEQLVTVTNVSVGGTVAIFGAAREDGAAVRLSRWQRAVEDTDRDGAVELALPVPIPADSVWIAVDVETGALVIATPPASRFRPRDFAPEMLVKGPDAKVDRFVVNKGMVDLLVVRPHVGAWTGYAVDGHGSDGDRAQDGRSTVVFTGGRSLHGRVPPPAHLTPRDVIVAVALRTMEYTSTEVQQ